MTDGDECICRLDQAGVGHVLDANVLGVVPELACILDYFGLSAGAGLVERERRGQFVVGVDLRLEIGDLLLGEGDGICAGDEAARRRLFAGDPDERSCELGWIAGLLPVLRLPPLELLRPAFGIVMN